MQKPWLVFISVIVVLALLAGSCMSGFLVGRTTAPLTSGQPSSTGNPSSTAGTPSNLTTLFKPFWETWDIIHKDYVDQPVDDVKLVRGAIQGMIAALGDDHSSYMDPDEYKDATTQLEGEYEGIGAWVDTEGQWLTISSPMSGSPAEAAGLRAGDEIIAIDGEDMTGVAPELVRKRVLGPKGSTVVLTIRRPDVADPFDVTITRATIRVPSVESKMLDGQIAYVRLNTFGDTTAEELHTALEELLKQEPVGLILDLRNNGGGYLPTAIKVASEFIADGVIMYEAYGDGQRDTFKARSGGLATEIPMLVLVNQYSASASEIVAGAIQDRGRGQLVGVVTFGKGTVQTWTPLSDEQGAVRITVARWLTPNGVNIHHVGLTPEVIVEMTEDDYNNDRDPQLDKAIEILLGK
jgi:carboxyl-terminal processing protease